MNHIQWIKTLTLTVFMTPALAIASRGETPIGDGLMYFIEAMYGATGIAIATIAIMITGLLALGHFLKWLHFVLVVVGISMIFGAGTFVNGIRALVG